MAALSFEYAEMSEPVPLVKSLAGRMHLHQPEKLLSYPYEWPKDIDTEGLQEVLVTLRPETASALLVDPAELDPAISQVLDRASEAVACLRQACLRQACLRQACLRQAACHATAASLLRHLLSRVPSTFPSTFPIHASHPCTGRALVPNSIHTRRAARRDAPSLGAGDAPPGASALSAAKSIRA